MIIKIKNKKDNKKRNNKKNHEIQTIQNILSLLKINL